jgi:hypothetical protein
MSARILLANSQVPFASSCAASHVDGLSAALVVLVL